MSEDARRPDRAQLRAYADAVMTALDGGDFATAEAAIRRLSQAYPQLRYAAVMREFFERLPPAGEQPPFTDDLTAEFQIVRRAGADTVLLVFSGFDHRMGVSLSAMHRWFGRLPVQLVYLRDLRSLFYLGGLSSLGADLRASLAATADIAAGLGARRILCCGCSGGLYASLQWGLALGAEAVFGLAGPTNLSPEFNEHLRTRARVAHLWRQLPQAPALDLRRAYAEAARPPRVLLAYDRNNWDDRLHAEYLAGLPSLRLDPVEDTGFHAVNMVLILNGTFEARLDWLLGGAAPAGGP